jgi:hypothetical protein
MKILRKQLLGLLCLFFQALPAAAQTAGEDGQPHDLTAGIEISTQSGDVVRIQRFDHDQVDVRIDGHLDEAVWKGLRVFDQFVVIEPDTLATPPYKTVFRMFYTEKGIYASYDLEQPRDTIVTRFSVRDDFDVNRDNAGFTLDTSGDGRYGYWVNLSIGDVQMDGTVLPERQFTREWDGAWHGATQLTESGWSSEFFLPWSQLAMPRQEDVRRIGLYGSRKVAHLNERWALPGLPRSQPRFMSSLQPLEFTGIDPKQQWSFFPFAATTFDRVDDDTRYRVGFDAFWRPSSNSQLTATVNPDFGSVEADDVVVNLSADETFFPEKRLFFQEGQDIFDATSRSEADTARRKVTLVNTRRIGASPREPNLPPGVGLSAREEAKLSDLQGAAKATGQIGRVRYGLLAALEDETRFVGDDDVLYLQDGRDFGAFRVLYEDNNGAAYRGLGFLSTIVAHPEADATVHAVDFHRLSTDGRWNIEGQVIYSDLDEAGSGYGGFTDIEYRPRQGRTHELQLTVFDDVIDINDFGFLRRNNNKHIRYFYELIRSDLKAVRNFEADGHLRYAKNFDGFTTSSGGGGNLNVTFHNLHTMKLHLAYSGNRYDDRNSFGNGTYEVASGFMAWAEYETDTAKPFSVFARIQHDPEDLGGSSVEGQAGLTWRPRHNILFNLGASYIDRSGWLLHQEDQNFTTFDATEWQPRFSLDYFPTAKQHFRVAFQWAGVRAREDRFYTLPPGTSNLIEGPKPSGPTDAFSVSELNFQVRYRWQIAPLSDLFIVYTRGDSRETNLTDFDTLFRDSWNMPLGDQLVIKFRYRLGT